MKKTANTTKSISNNKGGKKTRNDTFKNETTSKLDSAKRIFGLIALIPGVIFSFIIVLFFLFIVVSVFFSGSSNQSTANTAIIGIRGFISVDELGGFVSSGGTSSETIEAIVQNIKQNKHVKAVIFDINSGGGSPVGSEEIMTSIKELKKDGIVTVALIRELGASGAYWIATGTDYIIANELSIVGSVGVIGSYLDFSNFIEEYNVSYERLVAGEHKDTQIPFREMNDEERTIVQNRLDLLHDVFLNSVTENRGLSTDEKKAISKADVFLGREALDLNLIDQVGRKKDAIAYVEDKIGEEVKTAEYKKESSFFGMLSKVSSDNSYSIGRGIGESLFNKKNNKMEILT